MYAYRIAYDGREYHGYQRQPDVPTVEADLFGAFETLDVWAGDRPPSYATAGRTDAGVSALAQTIGVDAPDWLTPAALNARLPADIRAWASATVDPGFHATRDAHDRTYRYYLYAPSADRDRAATVLDRLSGTHDVHNLTPATDRTERSLTGSVTRAGPFLVIDVTAPGFVHELVRRIAGLVRRIATGAADPAFVEEVLGPEPIDGPAGIAPEPGTGLVLTAVTYPDVEFAVDPAAATAARQVFSDRAATAATSERVLDAIATGLPTGRTENRET
ncbi:MAG: tRNA pseudouridine(38-40) synthase TruA [Halobacteriaceae archaeon]